MNLHRALTLLLLAGLCFSACKKPTLEDTRLLPDDELDLRFTDTLSIEAETISEDSVDQSPATLCLLGSMHDPALGYTNASFYMPFDLEDNNLTFDDDTVSLDSVVLTMWYFNTYGDLRTPQTVEVFEMAENIDDSVKYFSDTNLSVYQNPVGAKTFIPNTKDSITVGGIKAAPSLSIRLNDSFGQKFIIASGSSDYADNGSFQEYFKGLYVTASKAGGGKGLAAFNPYQDGVRITVYYHKTDGTDTFYTFPAAAPLVVNHYEHDYRNSSISTGGDSLVFIQGLAGLNTRVKVPNLRNLGNILINKAELVVTVVPAADGRDSVFSPPAQLTLAISDADGNFIGGTSDQVFPTSIFGGDREEETDSLTGQKLIKYKFSLARYYQEVVSEIRADYGIFILPDKRYQIPDRIVAGSGNHSQYAIKLNLVYDIIN